MKLMDNIVKEAIIIDLASKDKIGVISELTEALVKAKKVSSREKIIRILLDREELGSTGIGSGVAIPHGKTDEIDKVIIAFGSSKAGIEFASLDGAPVHLVFLLLAPADSAGEHLQALAKISRMVKDKRCRPLLREASCVEEIVKIITEEDKKQ